jgi:Peptidase A4 family/Putative Ig domain
MRRKSAFRLGGVAGVCLLALGSTLTIPSAASAHAGAAVTSTKASASATRGAAPVAGSLLSPGFTSAAPTAAPTVPARNSATTSADGQGYWMVASDGGVFTFGDARYFGSTGGRALNKPIVGMAPTPDGQGYWLVASDGGIFTFGDAGYFGSTGDRTLNDPIVGMAATPDGQGYWLVASDGGIFAFGDAGYYGSTGAMRLNQPIVGMATTADGRGYWLVASDGGIFSFGDAAYAGSTGAMKLNQPIVAMAATPDGRGYWLMAADGGVFTFGDAGYFGSVPATGTRVGNIVATSSAGNGQGYWIVGSNGAVNSFGDALGHGSTAGVPLNKPIVGFAAVPQAIPSQESPAPLTVTTTAVGNGQVGTAYSTNLTAAGGTPPYAWTLIGGSLPPGLTLSRSGAIAGIPTQPANASFTVQVTDDRAPTPLTATASLSLVVSSTPLSIRTTTLPNAIAGAGYSTTLTAAGGDVPYLWTLTGGSLPAGLALSPGGAITGTPMQQGDSTFTVKVVDSSAPTPVAASSTLSIDVFAPTSSVPTVLSSNWSGYVELNGPFTTVTGTFSVPSLLSGTPPGDLLAEWVGIDGGDGDNSLIQAGFNESPDIGSPTGFDIQPWWEILPSAETFIPSVQIHPGDQVTVNIAQIGATQWSITLTDDTDGQSFNIDRSYSGPASTAEWIVEALTVSGKVATLAPYAPVVNFTDLGFSAATTKLQEVVMVQDGDQVSTPSALTANGFNVAYGNLAPQPP